MFKKEDEKDQGRLSAQRPVATSTLARPMRRISRRRKLPHQNVRYSRYIRRAKTSQRASIGCGEFYVVHRTWTVLVEQP